jgi:hypothetical protein
MRADATDYFVGTHWAFDAALNAIHSTGGDGHRIFLEQDIALSPPTWLTFADTLTLIGNGRQIDVDSSSYVRLENSILRLEELRLWSPLVIGSGGILTGNATIHGDVTNQNLISPGSTFGAIGTLRIEGNLTLAGYDSGYEVDINAAGRSDLLDVTGIADLHGSGVSRLLVRVAPGA